MSTYFLIPSPVTFCWFTMSVNRAVSSFFILSRTISSSGDDCLFRFDTLRLDLICRSVIIRRLLSATMRVERTERILYSETYSFDRHGLRQLTVVVLRLLSFHSFLGHPRRNTLRRRTNVKTKTVPIPTSPHTQPPATRAIVLLWSSGRMTSGAFCEGGFRMTILCSAALTSL